MGVKWEYAEVACFYDLTDSMWNRKVQLPGQEPVDTKIRTHFYMRDILELLGLDGWELVSVVGTGAEPTHGFVTACRYTFKRAISPPS